MILRSLAVGMMTTLALGAFQPHDPLYVFEEIPLPPGTYLLHVTFTRETGAVADSGAVVDPRAAPPRLVLDTTVTLAAGRAALVTYDEDARRLYVVTEH